MKGIRFLMQIFVGDSVSTPIISPSSGRELGLLGALSDDTQYQIYKARSFY